jgi:hypothetical protein
LFCPERNYDRKYRRLGSREEKEHKKWHQRRERDPEKEFERLVACHPPTLISDRVKIK